MRKLVIAIGIVVVLILASPFIVGVVAESTVRARLDAMNEGRFMAIRVDSYDRGWLGSRTRLELGLGDAYLSQIEAMAEQPAVTDMLRSFGIPVIVEFTHGPILLGEVSGIGFLGVRAYADPESQPIELAETFLGVPYLFEFRGISKFGDGFHFTGDIPPFGGALGDLSYEFSGVDVTGISTISHVEFEAVLDEASVQSSFMSAVLESMRMTGNSELRPDTISPGTSEATLGRLTIVNPSLGASPMLSAENLGVATTVSENAEATHLDAEVVYRIGRMAVAGAFEVSDAALGLRAAHIDSAALREIIEAAGEIMETSSAQMNDNLGTMVAGMMPLIDRIATGSPELTIDPLQFSLAEGDFKGRLRIGLDGSALPTGSFNDMMDPAVVRRAVTAEAEITAAKPLVEMLTGLIMAENMPLPVGPGGEPLPPDQAAAVVDAQVAQQLGMLETFGLIRDLGNDYSCMVALKGGELTANGQPVPLPF